MRLAGAFSDSTPTMLGIGPMSAVTVRAGLHAAAEDRIVASKQRYIDIFVGSVMAVPSRMS
jgi:hypothetical protein